MSILTGKGFLVSYMETEVICPICTAEFDCGQKSEKARYPLFNMRCPKCNGWVTINMPIFGGNTTIEERYPPKIKDGENKIVMPNEINYEVPKPRPEDADESDIFV